MVEARRIAEGLFASGMPRPWEVEDIVREYDAIVSLATPIEHAWGGYDPRLLPTGIRFHWLPTPEYNAPYLNRLAEAVRKTLSWLEEGLRILVHDWRGCSRAAMFAASILVAKGYSYIEALSQVSSKLMCSVETAVQVQAVRGLGACIRASLSLKDIEAMDDMDVAVCEYAATLASELTPYTNINLARVAGLVREEEGGSDVEKGVAELARLVTGRLDYAIAWISASRRGLRIMVWIPRAAHPQVVQPSRRLSREDMDIVKRVWGRIASLAGLEDTVTVEYYEPHSPPPPPI